MDAIISRQFRLLITFSLLNRSFFLYLILLILRFFNTRILRFEETWRKSVARCLVRRSIDPPLSSPLQPLGGIRTPGGENNQVSSWTEWFDLPVVWNDARGWLRIADRYVNWFENERSTRKFVFELLLETRKRFAFARHTSGDNFERRRLARRDVKFYLPLYCYFLFAIIYSCSDSAVIAAEL